MVGKDTIRVKVVRPVSEPIATPVHYGGTPDALRPKVSLDAVGNATQVVDQVFIMQSFQRKHLAEYENGNDVFGLSDQQALSLLAPEMCKSRRKEGGQRLMKNMLNYELDPFKELLIGILSMRSLVKIHTVSFVKPLILRTDNCNEGVSTWQTENGVASVRILQAVRDLLKQRITLKSEPDAVTVLDGMQEGAFQWVTINYLLGNLGKDYSKTVGVVDLGGGSVQMAYAISESGAAMAPNVSDGEDPYVKEMFLRRRKYYLYVHSYLHYGLLAARAKILKVSGDAENPCILLAMRLYPWH